MADVERYDVVIVGAGPAGATAAIVLGRAGARVLLIERHRLPRPKLCAGLITGKTVDFLQHRLATSADGLRADGIIHTSARGYGIVSMAGSLVEGRLEDPFHLVDRSLYDAHWVSVAREAGARVRSGEPVLGVDAVSHPIHVIMESGHVVADAIIAADGATSRIRSRLIRSGFLPRMPVFGRGLALEAVADKTVWHGSRPQPILVFGVIPGGYGWLFPGPSGGGTLGVCGRNRSVRGKFTAAFHRLTQCLDVPETAVGTVKSHPLPLGCYYHHPGYKRILLVGDAAGLADPVLGEGIYYAHASGYLAAEALIKETANGQSAASRYADRLADTLIRELRWAGYWRRLLYGPCAWRQYRVLPWLFRCLGRSLEARVHGRRSFTPGRPSYI